MLVGFKDSLLRLNEGLRHFETWNEDTIRQRAEQLAALAAQFWALPDLSEEKLATFRAESESSSSYTFTDHTNLATGSPMRKMFDSFRKEELALGLGITEEILKVYNAYNAYKAETNFVDVIPQRSQLRLSLSLRAHELYDPRGLARDVINLGQWGNGDVQVAVSTLEELPHVMGLVRQALENQTGNGAVDV